jgi:hypothetical protein
MFMVDRDVAQRFGDLVDEQLIGIGQSGHQRSSTIPHCGTASRALRLELRRAR